MLCITLFWNGIVSAFVMMLWEQFQKGRLNWLLVVFLLPFVAIGLVLIAALFQSFLTMFNPRSKVHVDKAGVVPGESFQVDWELTGPVERVQNMRISLQGREEATYVHGTDSSTDTFVFMDREVEVVQSKSRIRRSSTSVTIPAGAIHSFSAPNNKIVWSVCLHGQIPGWPDMKDFYDIVVLPLDLSDRKIASTN